MKIFAGLSCLILLFCVGCNRTSPWSYKTVHSDYPVFNSSQLSYTPKNPFNGLGVQILQGDFGTTTFLCIYNREFETPQFSFIEEKKKVTSYSGTILLGGQRMELPQEATAYLLEKLRSGETITLCCGSYLSAIALSPKLIRKISLF